MKANELRIGNLVYYKNKNKTTERTVINIEVPDLMFIEDPVKDTKYSPIPLTEEWLLKFGFKYLSETQMYEKTGNEFDFHISIGNWVEIGQNNYESAILKFNIQYVHQLQNLYSALNGEELTN